MRPPRPTRVWVYNAGPRDVSRTSRLVTIISGMAGASSSAASATSAAALTRAPIPAGARSAGRFNAERIGTAEVRNAGFGDTSTADDRFARLAIYVDPWVMDDPVPVPKNLDAA